MTQLIPQGGQTLHTTCQCWTLYRKDGVVVRVTEHDTPLLIAGEAYTPGALIETSQFTLTSDFSAGEASVEGAIDSEAISNDDIVAGLWDGARVEIFRVDWRNATRLGHIWTGTFGQIVHEGERFSVRLLSQKAQFLNLVGRAYTRQCDAVLGDARCGIDTLAPEFSGLSCDQHFETCTGTFANAANFRGFPHMPGSDFLLAGPNAQTQS
ncbi:MAG: DUF2163 domain-containing protein [Pseudomonadota bacterium]